MQDSKTQSKREARYNRILRPLRIPQFYRAVFAEIRQRARRLRGQLRAGCADCSEDNKHCKNGNIPVIFYEELAEPRTAEIICGETGCAMRLFHSCHNVSRDEFESGVGYLSLMNDNLRNLREALS